MSLLKQIDDKAPVVAWSPVADHPALLALGSKEGSGSGFDDVGGDLSLYPLDFSDTGNTSVHPAGSVKVTSRFQSLAWTELHAQASTFSHGLIAGGMEGGTVNIWDPAKILQNDGVSQAQIARVQRHSGGVRALQFNPHTDSSHLLASGGSDKEVFIMALERADAPTIFSPGDAKAAKHQAEVTCVAWNSQVSHILASGDQSGSVMVWDIKASRPWCELKDPKGGATSTLVWNPDEGLHLVTASDDDGRPVLRCWDLRSSTTTPFAELQGHQAGIFAASWCPQDSSRLLTCGKDNRTFMWDLAKGQVSFELPASSTAGGDSGSFFGGAAGSGGSRRYDVQWSPRLPGVVSACSFDRKVQIYSMSGVGGGRAPKWLSRKIGATFGFGGKLVVFGGIGAAAAQNPSKVATVTSVVDDPSLAAASDKFESALAGCDWQAFCQQKEQEASSEQDKETWSFMRILFEQDARQHLLRHLGFDAAAIAAEVAKHQTTATPSEQKTEDSTTAAPAPSEPDSTNAADVFGSDAIDTDADTNAAGDEPGGEADGAAVGTEAPANEPSGSEAEVDACIQRALLVGNFEGAVDCCLSNNRLADALLLSTCAGADLWERTKQAYFETQKRPYMNIVAAVIRGELAQMVEKSDLGRWKETLAILSTYAKSDEFAGLCNALGARLENESSDLSSATLCYMCGRNAAKAVGIWVNELRSSSTDPSTRDSSSLQSFVERVIIFKQALAAPDQDLGGEVASEFSTYAAMLASAGRIDVASKYVQSSEQSCVVLRDRLYHASAQLQATTQQPAFPFQGVAVTSQAADPAQVTQQTAVATQQQSQQQQQQSVSTPAQQPMQQPQSVQAQPFASRQQPQVQQQQPQVQQMQPQVQQQQPQVQQMQPQVQQQQPQVQQIQSQVQQQQPQVQQMQPQMQQQQPRVQQMQPQVQQQQPQVQQMQPQMQQQQPQVQQQWQQPQGAAAPPAQPASWQPRAATAPRSSGGIDLTKAASDGFICSAGGASETAIKLGTRYGNANKADVLTDDAAPAVPQLPSGDTSQIPADHKPIMDCLNNVAGQLEGASLVGGEKRQMIEVRKALVRLSDKLNRGELDAHCCSSMLEVIGNINQANFRGALAVVTGLTTTHWSGEKDWLKGVKGIVQLCLKKFASG